MAEFIIKLSALVVASYFIGGIHFASLLARINGVNIKDVGSGNPGTMNMLRNFGVKTAVFTLILDALKALIPSVVGYMLLAGSPYLPGPDMSAPAFLGYFIPGGSKAGAYIGGMSVIIGHVFPVFNKFKGGKGVASSVGVLLTVNPIVAVVAFILAFTYLYFCKYGSVASFIFLGVTIVTEIVLAIVYSDNLVTLIMIIALFSLIIWAHRGNIVRLIRGQESDINIRRQIQKKREGKLLGGKKPE